MPTFRPGKPRIHLGLSAAVPAQASNTPFTWTNVVSQEGGGWNPLTPTLYTITKTGLWIVTFAVLSLTGTATSQFGIFLRVNGVDVSRTQEGSGSGGNFRGQNLTYLADLQVNDVIEAGYYLTAGTRDLAVNGTYLQLARVGPERWTG